MTVVTKDGISINKLGNTINYSNDETYMLVGTTLMGLAAQWL